MLKELTVAGFVAETSSDSPAPGGGSVSALAAAQAAALLGMVANLTVKSKKYEEVHEEMQKYAEELKELELDFVEDIDRDSNSFNGVMAAFKLPKETEEEKAIRSKTIQEEYKKAASVPLNVGLKTLKILDYAEVLVEKGNSNAITDVGVGLLNLKLAIRGAFYNVKINLGSIKDEEFIAETKKQMAEALEKVEVATAPLLEKIEAAIE
ncbi:formiminotetrahydrofolate cyclodeaminase [Peptoniphilus asaccharolyticus DSM 20463]|uniref:Formiminotetrahydrofolate cyclodeaminase n=1 Tax=Peptoniphilus asaccharolyticus DSM 20463 TaxID=573058 RepID=A0A1W1V9A1_PEPAS|nr:cyclodeaminase/cyclohydrolase family protein [Peptoniphilus asaccharolyticus]MBL7575806.1 cyclodeaminase/cyclohydrolase family protein [Peptoniphilus asaccharolyticus]SMB89843.1 formiminotetrahydrofolate cyclodeaminase [Peptoniphilus asaccharolyticus DSM 20463]